MRADPDDRLSLDMFAPATPDREIATAEKPAAKKPGAKAPSVKAPSIRIWAGRTPRARFWSADAPSPEASSVKTVSAKTPNAKTMSGKTMSGKARVLDDPPAINMAPISAEASSESLRPPTYDELWSDPRHAATLRPAPAHKDRTSVWAGVIAIIMGVTALIALREKIVDLAPPAAKVFALLGLPVNLNGLELRGLHARIEMDGARKVLAIEGEIANLRHESTPAPPVALTVRGEDGQAKYAWTTRAPKSRLEPGETITFRARLASPPETGADVLIRFASIEEAVGRKSVTGVK